MPADLTCDSASAARAAVLPAETRQLAIGQRLHAEADAVHSGTQKPAHPIDGHRFRVGLEGHLGIRRDGEAVAARVDQLANLVGLEQRRRPAAEEDRVRRAAVARATDLRLERRDVSRLQPGVEQTSIEVAVVADVTAERDVEVEAQHSANCEVLTAKWSEEREVVTGE